MLDNRSRCNQVHIFFFLFVIPLYSLRSLIPSFLYSRYECAFCLIINHRFLFAGTIERSDSANAKMAQARGLALLIQCLGARRARSREPKSPAPKTPGNPIMIIIPGESIAALDRIGPVRPVPGSRYPSYNADVLDAAPRGGRGPGLDSRYNTRVRLRRRGW